MSNYFGSDNSDKIKIISKQQWLYLLKNTFEGAYQGTTNEIGVCEFFANISLFYGNKYDRKRSNENLKNVLSKFILNYEINEKSQFFVRDLLELLNKFKPLDYKELAQKIKKELLNLEDPESVNVKKIVKFIQHYLE